ncbi:ABC transporter ATP-binding protein [Mycoplasmatota bacterium]|nr:ABC transporter ATP-binding protein [Mycoplasmatota bacterium]
MNQIIKAENIKKYYGKGTSITKAVNGIDLRVYEGEFIAIMGASGSGKTTLLNMFSTLDKPTSGKLLINDIDVSKINKNKASDFRREELGFIFQDFNLLDTLTIYDNIAFSLAINHANEKIIKSQVNSIAQKLDIMDILNKFPYEISGGQKQRATAARAIINKPSLVLADEPTGALDSKTSKTLLETISYINSELNTTVLMVTHDSVAASYANSVIFIRDGRVFTRAEKGNRSRREFFEQILDTISVLEGGNNDDI